MKKREPKACPNCKTAYPSQLQMEKHYMTPQCRMIARHGQAIRDGWEPVPSDTQYSAMLSEAEIEERLIAADMGVDSSTGKVLRMQRRSYAPEWAVALLAFVAQNNWVHRNVTLRALRIADRLKDAGDDDVEAFLASLLLLRGQDPEGAIHFVLWVLEHADVDYVGGFTERSSRQLAIRAHQTTHLNNLRKKLEREARSKGKVPHGKTFGPVCVQAALQSPIYIDAVGELMRRAVLTYEELPQEPAWNGDQKATA